MAKPKLKTETYSQAPEVAAAKRADAPRPLAVTGVTTRQPSPVHGLQSDLARAFAETASSERKIPFGVTLAGASAFSLACWALLFVAIRAII